MARSRVALAGRRDGCTHGHPRGLEGGPEAHRAQRPAIHGGGQRAAREGTTASPVRGM
jgi:hypothetical protein